MGTTNEMNYVELPRKPSQEETQCIQQKCNQIIQQNFKITVQTPDDATVDSLPDNYDKARGVVRVVKIGDLDNNTYPPSYAAEPTSLKPLIYLSFFYTKLDLSDLQIVICILLPGTVPLTSQPHLCVAKALLQKFCPVEILLLKSLIKAEKMSQSLGEYKKKERKLLMEVAGFEAERVKSAVQAGKMALVHRADGGLECINFVVYEIKDVVKDTGTVLLVSGEGKQGGHVVIIGEEKAVGELVRKVQDRVQRINGGGKGRRWQGKVAEWGKGELEALKRIVET